MFNAYLFSKRLVYKVMDSQAAPSAVEGAEVLSGSIESVPDLKVKAQSIIDQAKKALEYIPKASRRGEVKNKADGLIMAITFLKQFMDSYDKQKSAVNLRVFNTVLTYLNVTGNKELINQVEQLNRLAVVMPKIMEMRDSSLNQVLRLNSDTVLVWVAPYKMFRIYKVGAKDAVGDYAAAKPEEFSYEKVAQYTSPAALKRMEGQDFMAFSKIIGRMTEDGQKHEADDLKSRAEVASERARLENIENEMRARYQDFLKNPRVRDALGKGFGKDLIVSRLQSVFSERITGYNKLPSGFEVNLGDVEGHKSVSTDPRVNQQTLVDVTYNVKVRNGRVELEEVKPAAPDENRRPNERMARDGESKPRGG